MCISKKRRILTIALTVMVWFAYSSFGSLSKVDAASNSKVKLSKSKVTMYVGSSKGLQVKGTKKKVSWKSSNKAVVTVSSKGKLKAKKAGSAKITARIKGGKKLTCKVTVKKKTVLNKTRIKLKAGSSAQLRLINKTGKVNWKSSNSSVAAVSSSGKVSAKRAGTATIGAKHAGKTYTCKVTTVPDLQLSGPDRIKAGHSVTIKVSSDAANPNPKLVWKSSKKKVATVDQKGKVTAIAPGRVTIICRTQDKMVQIEYALLIMPATNYVSEIEIDAYPYAGMGVGDGALLQGIAWPHNTAYPNVKWSTTTPNLISVDGDNWVTALKPGIAKVVCTSADGRVSKTSSFKVKGKNDKKDGSVVSIYISAYDGECAIGDTIQLYANIQTTDSHESLNGPVTWKSSNSRIATVGKGGWVNFLDDGKVTITCTTKDGKMSASVTYKLMYYGDKENYK